MERKRAIVVVFVVTLALVTAGAAIWHSHFRCTDSLALSAPDAEVSFDRSVSEETLTITNDGPDALIDADNRTYRGCTEEWEPDRVFVTVTNDTLTQGGDQYRWLARNGSGAGSFPLAAGDSVTLVEPAASANGDIRLRRPLEGGDVVRVIGQSDAVSAELGRYLVDADE